MKLCPYPNPFWASCCKHNRNLGQTRLPYPLHPTRIAVKRDLLAPQIALHLLQIRLKLGERCMLASKIRQRRISPTIPRTARPADSTCTVIIAEAVTAG